MIERPPTSPLPATKATFDCNAGDGRRTLHVFPLSPRRARVEEHADPPRPRRRPRLTAPDRSVLAVERVVEPERVVATMAPCEIEDVRFTAGLDQPRAASTSRTSSSS